MYIKYKSNENTKSTFLETSKANSTIYMKENMAKSHQGNLEKEQDGSGEGWRRAAMLPSL